MRLSIFLAACLTCASLIGVGAVSADIILSEQPGTTYQTDGFTGFTTGSAEMVGLNVTVTFADNSTETLVWTATGIVGNGWSLTHGPGSSFSDPFVLVNSSGLAINALVLHGGGSTTLFDRAASVSTDGTANGRDLLENSSFSLSQDIQVTYFDQIQVTGSTPVGDIFAGLQIEFSDGFASNSGDFSFVADTDTATSLLVAVPEPQMAWGLLVALGTVIRIRRRA